MAICARCHRVDTFATARTKHRCTGQQQLRASVGTGTVERFQYRLLSSEVQLDKAGTLLLGLSLEGNNPGLYEGQAIRFNINVEQNLDPLLQSLRIGDKDWNSGLKTECSEL